jgi:glutamate synthase domain-containing protein 1
MNRQRFTRPLYTREFSACGITGLLNMDRELVSGKKIRDMICVMRERENGLGAGFAVYGLFPKYRDQYCLQLILEDLPDLEPTKERVEEFLKTYAEIVKDERVPVEKNVFREYPLIWRFFIDPKNGESADDEVKDIMMHINSEIDGAFCLSGGKDMAVFKGSGWSNEIADFYRVEKIKGYMWSFHSRFPTNTPGWWGGAHPFSILGHAVIHNGEITSYGTNVEYLKEMGYRCELLTDTEVVAYLFDYFVRKSGYPAEIVHQIAAMALSPPYWRDIDRMPPELKKWARAIRLTHRRGMANGPFCVVITTDCPQPALIGHSDRKKLRPLIAAVSEDEKTFYLASELSAIHEVDDTPNYWQPDPGKPAIATLEGVVEKGTEMPFESLSKKIG